MILLSLCFAFRLTPFIKGRPTSINIIAAPFRPLLPPSRLIAQSCRPPVCYSPAPPREGPHGAAHHVVRQRFFETPAPLRASLPFRSRPFHRCPRSRPPVRGGTKRLAGVDGASRSSFALRLCRVCRGLCVIAARVAREIRHGGCNRRVRAAAGEV